MKDLEWIKKGYFAHRGLHTKSKPENTMAAFKNAVKHGFDIELDILMTKDKQIIVYHDSNLLRLCKVDLEVGNETYDKLKVHPIKGSNETIPLLSEVLDTLPKKTMYLIELKPQGNYKEFVELFLELMDKYDVTYAIHSFDPRIVNEFRKQDDSIIRGQISSTFPKDRDINHFIVKHLLLNFLSKPDFINYHFEDLPRKRLDKLYRKGKPIISYVAKSQKGLDFVRSRYDNAVFENFIPIKKGM